jgi:hypothetical protein
LIWILPSDCTTRGQQSLREVAVDLATVWSGPEKHSNLLFLPTVGTNKDISFLKSSGRIGALLFFPSIVLRGLISRSALGAR